jgi:hypothetical protein
MNENNPAYRWTHILAQLATLQWLIHVDKMPATGRGAQ